MTSVARPELSAVRLPSEDDPYPAYARLREAGPLYRAELGQWLVTHHAACSTLLRDNRLVSQIPPQYTQLSLGDGPAASFLDRIVLFREPPDHTQLRRFVGRALGEPVVRALRQRVADRVDELLQPGLDSGVIDIVTGLAVPLPVGMVCDLIGIPPTDRDDVLPRVVALAKVFDAVNLEPADVAQMNEALPWLRTYLEKMLADHRERPGGPTLAGMYWDGGERLDVDDFIDNMLFLFHAGFETTMGLVSNGCAALLRNPDELRRLRAEPALVTTAIEEFLRYDAPIQNVIRIATEAVEYGGVKIRQGRTVLLLLGAANRDERVFADPDRLDVGRHPNPHLGFGGGLHHCLGTALARLMAESVFDRLTRRVAHLEPAGEPARRRHGSLRSYERLPVAIRPA